MGAVVAVGVAAQVHAAHPRGDAPVVEADPQVVLHLHGALQAFHTAHEVCVVVTGRQEVRDEHPARGGPPLGLQDERLRDVPAGDHLPIHRTELPAPVVLVPQQRAEHSGRVEAREAQPVDAALPRDQGAGVQIGQQGVVLQGGAHGGH